MKKLSLFFFATLLLIAAFTLSVFAADAVVYVDGTVAASGDGSTPAKAIKTLAAGIKALPKGGTLVVCGDTSITGATQLAATSAAVTITSEYGGVKYDAVFGLGARLVFTGDATFENITIHNASTAQQSIFARGYTLTMGEGITCTTNGDALCYPVLYGGKYNGAHVGNSHIVIQSGTFRAVYGGNYENSFTGNSVIDFTGGTVLVTLVGGSFAGNFTGNTTINIGGDAVMKYNTVASINFGVVGSSCGDGIATGDSLTFVGDIAINIFGNAQVYSNVLGGAPRADVTTKGDITIDIYGNARLYRHVYGGGAYGNVETDTEGILVTVRENAVFTNPSDNSDYICAGPQQGTVTGNVKVVVKDNVLIPGNVCAGGNSGTVIGTASAEMYGGEVKVNFTAGTRVGTVQGDTFTAAYGGKIGYHASGKFALRGNGGYASDTAYGRVTGNATVLLDGADVAGAATLGGMNGTLTLKSGAAGNVEGTAVIDLSGGKSLTLGGEVTASALIGGGTLTLSSAGSLTAASLAGDVSVLVGGKVWPGTTYITVTDTASTGNIVYGGDGAVFTRTSDANGIYYTVNGEYLTTAVTVTYYNPDGSETQPDIVFYRCGETNTKITSGITYGETDGKKTATVSLAPGLYYYKVYYNGASDYQQKYFYVSGKTEALAFDHPLRPYAEKSYMESVSHLMNDEIIETFFTMEGYPRLDTPTFTRHADDGRTFQSNAEICAYLEALAEDCEYMHVYYPFPLSEYGNKYPVVVFTKDEIPEDATFDEVGKIVRGGGIREIMMTTGGVHGLEPAGIESQLVYAKALTGEYGEKLFANEKFGAVVIVPCVSVDNYQRLAYTYLYDDTLLYAEGINPQRNLMALQREGTQNQVYVYKTFMPTVYVDHHEDYSTIKIDYTDLSISYSANASLSNFEDVAIRYSPLQNSPLVDIDTVIGGSTPAADQAGMDIQMEAIGSLSDMGLRAGVYFISNTMPNTSWPYAKARGSYGFLIEVMRIRSGKTRYERAVFAQSEAIKAITDEVASRAGELAQNVYDGRQAAIVTEFDADNVFAKKTTYTGRTFFTFPRLNVYIDGTVKETVEIKMGQHDTVSDFVTMPTAYVLPTDEPHIETILDLLDMHGIEYTEIRAGSTLTLRKYAGLGTVNTDSEAVTVGEATEVTFADGAYVITTDTSDSYLIAYLFEPDSFPFTSYDETTHSLTNMGYITDGDALYRSEVDNMADVIADMAVGAVYGDLDGDGRLGIPDVLLALRAILNEENAAVDMNKDGKLSLADVLRLMKSIHV